MRDKKLGRNIRRTVSKVILLRSGFQGNVKTVNFVDVFFLFFFCFELVQLKKKYDEKREKEKYPLNKN